jgi:hypothetical protein
MPPTRPFVDPVTGTLDTDQILTEAVPLGKLVGLFVAVAFVPLTLAFLLGGGLVGALFALAAQFVLAVGAGVVLLYVVIRGIHLAEESTSGANVRDTGPEPDADGDQTGSGGDPDDGSGSEGTEGE